MQKRPNPATFRGRLWIDLARRSLPNLIAVKTKSFPDVYFRRHEGSPSCRRGESFNWAFRLSFLFGMGVSFLVNG